jgi:hypothetical protein
MGSFFLVFNAIMNFDHLNAGRSASPSPAATQADSGEEE